MSGAAASGRDGSVDLSDEAVPPYVGAHDDEPHDQDLVATDQRVWVTVAARNVVGGMLAMAVTYLTGTALGTQV